MSEDSRAARFNALSREEQAVLMANKAVEGWLMHLTTPWRQITGRETAYTDPFHWLSADSLGQYHAPNFMAEHQKMAAQMQAGVQENPALQLDSTEPWNRRHIIGYELARRLAGDAEGQPQSQAKFDALGDDVKGIITDFATKTWEQIAAMPGSGEFHRDRETIVPALAAAIAASTGLPEKLLDHHLGIGQGRTGGPDIDTDPGSSGGPRRSRPRGRH